MSLPNGEAQKIIKKNYFKNKNIKFIDLSADFRIKNLKTYKKNYNIKHKASNLIKYSLYSIPEFSKKEIKKFRIISNPGCYPTSIQLPANLIKKKLIKQTTSQLILNLDIGGLGKILKKNFLIKIFLAQYLHITQNFIDMFVKLNKNFLKEQIRKCIFL